MLNGTFGVGKTTIATALQQRLPHALIFDPEPLGIVVRNLTEGVRTSSEDTDNFQDILLWRSLTIATAEGLYEKYRRPLIIPMTIVNLDYFTTIRTALFTIAPVSHFCLVAPLGVIRERLTERNDDVNDWVWRKSQQYVPQFTSAHYAQHVETANRSIPSITEEIFNSIGS